MYGERLTFFWSGGNMSDYLTHLGNFLGLMAHTTSSILIAQIDMLIYLYIGANHSSSCEEIDITNINM